MFNRINGFIIFNVQQLISGFMILISCAFIFSCHAGGTVVGANNTQNSVEPVYEVSVPSIVTPAANPYYSSALTTNITGLCMSGNTIRVADILGIILSSQTCTNYSFSTIVTAETDGMYNYYITQVASGGVVSIPVPFIWVKKSSIAVPTITSPAVLPYASAIDNLTIAGSCESNATVQLAGDAAGSTTCVNSSYSMNITKVGNGNFNIIVRQTDFAGNVGQTQFTWNKLGLGASPSAPTLQVGTTQVFTLVGGSGSYTATLTTNLSGATYDQVTNTYTAGSLAGVVDVLTVVDTAGVSVTVPITTYNGPADHFEYSVVSGNEQDGFTGQMLGLPFSARVVDRFGNGVSFYPVFFQITQGNGTVSGTILQSSDLTGEVKVNVIAGDNSLSNNLLLTPFGTTLPDVANTGNTKLNFTFTTQYSGAGLKGSLFSLSSNPNAIAVADLDSDGVSDTVVVNSAEPSLGVLTGLGNGLFRPMVKIKPICGNPNSVVLADVNEDTLKDIIITCGGSSAALQVFLNQGAGSFSTAFALPLDNDFESIPYLLKVVDLDADNHLDIISTNAGSSNVSIRKGVGNGTFAAPQFINVGASPADMGVGDFNRDGRKDFVVISSADSNMTFVMNLGSMSFDSSQNMDVGAAPLIAAVKDYNKDGWDDVAVLNTGSAVVTVYLNDQVGTFFERASLVTGGGPTAMDVLDIDGDGNFDIAVTNGTDNSVNVYFGDGTGLFDSSTLPIPVTLNPSGIVLTDINGDSVKDMLVIGNIMNQLEFIPGQAGRVFGFKTAVDNTPSDVGFFDFNKNGTRDMAVLSKGGRSVSIFNGTGKGIYTDAGLTLATGDDSESMLLVDLRNRGLKDIVVANPNRSSVRVFPAVSGGTFGAAVDVTTGTGPLAIASADFNRDSFPDLVVVNSNNASVTVLLNNGSGGFPTRNDFAVGSGPAGVVTVDLNRDGILDIVVTSGGLNSVCVLLGNGDGTFQTFISYGSGNGPSAIISGDLNKDGFEDIAVLATADNAIAVLLGNGDGSLRSVNTYSAGSGLNGLVVGDFNGDNRLDLATANADTFQFTVLHGTGNGQYNTTIIYDNPYPSTNIKSNDINGDNALDLILVDSTNNNINLWLGH